MAKGKSKLQDNFVIESEDTSFLELAEPKIEDLKESTEQTKLIKKEIPKPKVRFLVWFSGALDKFEGLKAHHMGAVQVFFARSLNIKLVQEPETFDEGLIKFGFRRKK